MSGNGNSLEFDDAKHPDLPLAVVNLLEISDAVNAGRPVSGEVAAWLCEGIERHLEKGEPLESALGLKPLECERAAGTTYRLIRRNEYLRAAWECCDGPRATTRSRNLAREISRFESVTWPRWSSLSEPPTDDPLKVNLFYARKLGGPLPGWRQIFNICATS